jgi:hypothetical protein
VCVSSGGDPADTFSPLFEIRNDWGVKIRKKKKFHLLLFSFSPFDLVNYRMTQFRFISNVWEPDNHPPPLTSVRPAPSSSSVL